MRLYRVEGEGEFVEYSMQSFSSEHIEQTLEVWLEGNPDAILGDGSGYQRMRPRIGPGCARANA